MYCLTLTLRESIRGDELFLLILIILCNFRINFSNDCIMSLPCGAVNKSKMSQFLHVDAKEVALSNALKACYIKPTLSL